MPFSPPVLGQVTPSTEAAMRRRAAIPVWIVLTVFLAPSLAQSQATHPCRGQWWQREIPSPSTNQIINPAYVDVKRSIEIECDQFNRTIQAIEHFRSLGQRPTALIESLGIQESKIKCLVQRLERTQLYSTPDMGAIPPVPLGWQTPECRRAGLSGELPETGPEQHGQVSAPPLDRSFASHDRIAEDRSIFRRADSGTSVDVGDGSADNRIAFVALGAALGAAGGALVYYMAKCLGNRDEYGNLVNECEPGSKEGFRTAVILGALVGGVLGATASSNYSPMPTGAVSWRGMDGPYFQVPSIASGPLPGSLRIPVFSWLLPNF